MTSQNVQPGSPSDPMAAARQIADNMTRASMEALTGGHRAYAALRAKQGSRTTFMISLSIGEMIEVVTLGASGATDEDSVNREIDPDWVKSIERGLRRKLAGGKDDSKYVLFPFTANIPEGVAIFRPLFEEMGGMSDMGILLIPRSTLVVYADGRHRNHALQNLIKEKPWFRHEAVNLFIIEESDVQQQRTDFADGAKVLPINVGLQAWFDSGVALNKATHELVSRSTVIGDGDVEKFKATVNGQHNEKIFTYNSLRAYVGTSFVRGTPGKTQELAGRFEDQMSEHGWDMDSLEMLKFVTEVAGYFDIVLDETAGVPIQAARAEPSHQDWNELRTKSWILKPSGLGAFGLLVYDLRQKAKTERPGMENEWVEEKIREVAQLDWRANSSLFKGTLVKGGKTQGSSTAQSHATIVLETKIGVLNGIPRRTAETLLELYDQGELSHAISHAERDSIRMARRD